MHQSPDSPVLDQVLECLVIRKSHDPGFLKASRTSELDSTTVSPHDGFRVDICNGNVTQERVTLVEANLHTWLLNSKIASHAYPNLSPEDQVIVNKTLKLKAGDDIWLGHRPRVPKVRSGVSERSDNLT